jgi:hypothetical protein
VRNELPPFDPVEFRVLALFPEAEPAGPRELVVLLGQQFVLHYGFIVHVDYSAIEYAVNKTGRRELTPSPGCGRLELR